MNIISDPLPTIDKQKNKEEFINRLLQQISIICREDKSFTIGNKIKSLNEYKTTLEEKENKLNILLDKSTKIKLDVQKQLDEIQSDILVVKQRLLNQLGSEL
jgi:hypothetical protein